MSFILVSRWRQEGQKFRVILGYREKSKPPGLKESRTKDKKRGENQKRTRKTFSFCFFGGVWAKWPMNQMYNQDPEKCGIWEEEGTIG